MALAGWPRCPLFYWGAQWAGSVIKEGAYDFMTE
jgi:hypothetical protein